MGKQKQPPPSPAPFSEKTREWARSAGLRYVTGTGSGIRRVRRGAGFVYFLPDGKRVQDAATLERIRSLVIPPAWTQVWICPSENGHIQAVGRDARGRKQYRYHPRYREVRDETKFNRMAEFGAVLPQVRAQVDEDLSLPGLPKQKVVAAIVRLMDETCIRVGNQEYARTNRSFGLTTLRRRHAEVNGDMIHLHFRGKSKQEQDIMLRDRRLSRIVKKCQDLPGQDLFEYQDEDAEPVRVTSSDVNDYLRQISGGEFSAKDFRTWHGTGHMAAQLSALGPAESEAEAKRNIVAAIKETAKVLGNRPAVCRKYYVHPGLLESYMEGTIFAAMENLPAEDSTAVSELRPAEAAVLRLVRGDS